jgi:hypothetical protein
VQVLGRRSRFFHKTFTKLLVRVIVGGFRAAGATTGKHRTPDPLDYAVKVLRGKFIAGSAVAVFELLVPPGIFPRPGCRRSMHAGYVHPPPIGTTPVGI